jgi:hypothetical protein
MVGKLNFAEASRPTMLPARSIALEDHQTDHPQREQEDGGRLWHSPRDREFS